MKLILNTRAEYKYSNVVWTTFYFNFIILVLYEFLYVAEDSPRFVYQENSCVDQGYRRKNIDALRKFCYANIYDWKSWYTRKNPGR